MRICPYCTYSNREGELYCEECGELLIGVAYNPISTKKLEVTGDSATLIGTSAWGTAHFASEAGIVLHFRDHSEPVKLQPANEITLGRADPASGKILGLDLIPYGAQEKGVSRLHAAIRKSENTLTLVDLGSVNGTFLNGQHLVQNQPRVLRDGDEIRLGKLVFHVYFK